MTTQDRDTAIEIFRNKVLEALDEAAREVFGNAIKTNCAGATDGDLLHIFPAIDAQLVRLCARYDWPLFDNYIGTDACRRDRAFLKRLGFPVTEDSAYVEGGTL